jgi:hypothetical protein
MMFTGRPDAKGLGAPGFAAGDEEFPSGWLARGQVPEGSHDFAQFGEESLPVDGGLVLIHLDGYEPGRVGQVLAMSKLMTPGTARLATASRVNMARAASIAAGWTVTATR